MVLPDPDFSFSDVPHAVGPSQQIDIIDVHTQVFVLAVSIPAEIFLEIFDKF
jgi:hypothetical protein